MENQIIFKDEEENDFVCGGFCIAGIVMAVAQTGVKIGKKGQQKEDAEREARMQMHQAIVDVEQEKKQQKRKIVETELKALGFIVMVLLVSIIFYKFRFALTVTAKK